MHRAKHQEMIKLKALTTEIAVKERKRGSRKLKDNRPQRNPGHWGAQGGAGGPSHRGDEAKRALRGDHRPSQAGARARGGRRTGRRGQGSRGPAVPWGCGSWYRRRRHGRGRVPGPGAQGSRRRRRTPRAAGGVASWGARARGRSTMGRFGAGGANPREELGDETMEE